MSYSNKSDILKQLAESALIELTDDEGTGSVNDDVVNRAIADSDATIEAYCARRYKIPLSSVPDKVRQVGVDIDIYNLYSRKGDVIPDLRNDRYKEAIRLLEKISEGKISLGLQPPPDPPAEGDYPGGSKVSVRDKDFDTDTMGKY